MRTTPARTSVASLNDVSLSVQAVRYVDGVSQMSSMRLATEAKRVSGHWSCPVCGEGYPSSSNAAVPRDGVVIEVMEEDMAALRPHLPENAVVHSVKECDD
jgi:hypothetical protein